MSLFDKVLIFLVPQNPAFDTDDETFHGHPNVDHSIKTIITNPHFNSVNSTEAEKSCFTTNSSINRNNTYFEILVKQKLPYSQMPVLAP